MLLRSLQDSDTFALSCTDGDVIICEIDADSIDGDAVTEKRAFPPPSVFGAHQPVPPTVASASSDGRFLALGRPLAGPGAVVVYDLKDAEAEEPYWEVPSFADPITALRFYEPPKRAEKVMDSVLCLTTASSEFYFFNVETKSMSEWSQKAGVPVGQKLPKEVVQRPDYPVGIAFDPKEQNQFMLVYHSHFILVDLLRSIPTEVLYHPPDCLQAKSRKKKREQEERESGGVAGGKRKFSTDSTDSAGMGKLSKKEKRRQLLKQKKDHLMQETRPLSVESAALPQEVEVVAGVSKNFRMVVVYSNIVFFDALSNDEFVVVEMPWARVSQALGGVAERKVYGA
jgi:hypothetical protein